MGFLVAVPFESMLASLIAGCMRDDNEVIAKVSCVQRGGNVLFLQISSVFIPFFEVCDVAFGADRERLAVSSVSRTPFSGFIASK